MSSSTGGSPLSSSALLFVVQNENGLKNCQHTLMPVNVESVKLEANGGNILFEKLNTEAERFFVFVPLYNFLKKIKNVNKTLTFGCYNNLSVKKRRYLMPDGILPF